MLILTKVFIDGATGDVPTKAKKQTNKRHNPQRGKKMKKKKHLIHGINHGRRNKGHHEWQHGSCGREEGGKNLLEAMRRLEKENDGGCTDRNVYMDKGHTTALANVLQLVLWIWHWLVQLTIGVPKPADSCYKLALHCAHTL